VECLHADKAGFDEKNAQNGWSDCRKGTTSLKQPTLVLCFHKLPKKSVHLPLSAYQG
jgi:hypothetical protein